MKNPVRNYTALNPLLKKSHVHLEKEENVDEIIKDGIEEYLNDGNDQDTEHDTD